MLELTPSVPKILAILKGSLALRRFPTFCGTLVGGYTFLQIPLRHLYDYLCIIVEGKNPRLRRWYRGRLAVPRFVAALLSAWFSLQLLNRYKPSPVNEATTIRRPGSSQQDGSNAAVEAETTTPLASGDTEAPALLAGKTLDLTILAASRALDSLITSLWRRSHSYFLPTTTSKAISNHASTFLFALSSGTIMWTWVYHPTRLPPTYNKWIASAADVDPRLIHLLREAHEGKMIYGQDTGHAHILQPMCRDYSWPLEWGDPEVSVPIPCDLVHMGTGPNCHYHAAVRFTRAFRFALATNLPLQLLVKSRKKPSFTAFRLAYSEAIRSSAFLGAFVGLFYYGVCLSRTRLGPKIFSSNIITPQMWDSGLCIGTGCVLCGWSILIEAERRREELALFVMPRAVGTLLPRKYDARGFWRGEGGFLRLVWRCCLRWWRRIGVVLGGCWGGCWGVFWSDCIQ